ncbi:MAG: response regulator [Dehalococcoidia bacterium]
MVVFKRKNSGLRYLRVADALRAKVAEGTYQPGECLPRQHDLAKEYNVAFGTLKQALDLLEGEGYVVRKVGQGTYASLPEERIETALVVDDEKSIRKFLTRFLAECGWKSVAVESGRVALEKLEERRFDLILLDLVLPDLDGAKTFREIRARDPEANVVIVTAYPDSALMSEALEVGPFAMIRKPFTLEEFRTLLNTVARRSESRMDERGSH